MRPKKFEGTNIVLGAAPGTEDRVENMPAFAGEMYEPPSPVIVSCHELDGDELMRVIETKCVYVITMGDQRQPVLLTPDNPIKKGWVR